MLWKVGGNFETVAVTCETNWKECVIAITNYLWSEVVSDVVDYLAKEGIIWVLAIAIASTILIRIKYCKSMHTEDAVLNKRILSKIGYKIQDLELKINVLTYKMHYGTWPLPHQVCNLNSKLKKLRMTLSNPGDRKNWLKHVLLNPSSESDICAPSNTIHSSKTKLMNRFDVKQEHAPQTVKRGELLTCSSIESLKSTSDQSVNIRSWRPNLYSRNASTKENNLSKSNDFTLQRRNVQLLPLDPNMINLRSSRVISPLTQNDVYATNAKYNSCQKFTDTIYKCKSFLKELQYKNKSLRSLNRSSEMSKASSSRAAHTAKRTALSTMGKTETPYCVPVASKKEEITEIKYAEEIKGNTVKDTEEICCLSKTNASNDAVVLNTNNCVYTPSKELISIVPIMQPTHNAQPSQETLHEVRKTLQNLHNALQTYQDTSRSSEKQDLANRIDKTDSFITYPVVDISSEYFDLSRSKGSLSSLAEYSSNTSKTYQRSTENVTLGNTYQHDIQKSVGNNLPAFVTTELNLRSCNAILRTSEDYENEYKKSVCEQNTLDNNRNKLESNPEINKDTVKTDILFNSRDSTSETISNKIFYILSPENTNVQTQNEVFLKKRLATENFSNVFDKKQDNVTITQNSSQSKILNHNREDKSTALLLQEALHFKNVLLTQSRKKYPSDVKQGDIADEFPPASNNNFPPMIIDIKEEAPVISNSHDKINQRYICLEMKQRRDVFPQSLKKVNTFVHRENEPDGTENQDCIPETSSEYFSITDLAVHNNAETESNVASTLPVYEKVISITIPIDMKSQSEINMNERLQTKAVLQNIQTRVNLRENLRESAASDIDNNVFDKHSSMLKLEDLILERIKNIRDYMDTFLQSQNTAIFKTRRALRCQSETDVFRYSDKASHVVIYDRSTAPSSCNSTDQVISSSRKSSDFLTHVWPNYIQKYKQETDNALKCSSDVYLKRNPGVVALITPIKNKFSNENDTRQSEAPTELEREEADVSLLSYSYKNDSKSTHRTDSITPRCEKRVVSNIENDRTNKKTIVDINTDCHKRRRQTQIAESKPSTIYFQLDVANAGAKLIHAAREDLAISNCNSISHSNSFTYFTDEEVISDIQVDNVPSKSTSNMKHSHSKSNVQKGKKQNVTKQIFVNERPDANIAIPSKLLSDNEYSNLTILLNPNLIRDKSEHNYSTNTKTASPLLKENALIFDPGASFLPFSLDKENKTLNADSTSLNILKHDQAKNKEISINIAHMSPQIEYYSTKPFQTYPQIKAKSDVSLITNRDKDLKVNLYPKKSFLMRHNTIEYISSTLHQTCAKLHNDKHKCMKNKLRLTTQSKSNISPRRVSTKSCIPILKNRLESSHRMKHQAQARSPMRSPLTMLWGEKTCTRDHMTDKEIAQSDNVLINKHLQIETMSNLTKFNTEKDILDKKFEKPENVTCGDSDTPKKSSEILSSDLESLTIEKRHADKRDIYGSKSDTSIIQHIKKIASKEIVVISIMANDSLQKKYPADLFILNTKNISPTTDLLIHKNKLWTITVEKTEKEVTAKPSITDTCTSTSVLQ